MSAVARIAHLKGDLAAARKRIEELEAEVSTWKAVAQTREEARVEEVHLVVAAERRAEQWRELADRAALYRHGIWRDAYDALRAAEEEAR